VEILSVILECVPRNLAGGEKMGVVIKVMSNISLLVQNGGKEENKEKREKEKAKKYGRWAGQGETRDGQGGRRRDTKDLLFDLF
jgi:hypothetical protein